MKKNARAWSFRLEQELKDSYSAVFLTLTYNEEHLPISENGYATLHKPHFQKFMKRLRSWINDNITDWDLPLKYYAVGEYGSKTHRPHYHLVLFNLPKAMCKNDYIEKFWNMGNTLTGTVTTKSINYVSGYLKKNTKQETKHSDDDRVPECNFPSKGLGKGYLTKAKIEYYRAKMEPYLKDEQGKKRTMPRYYKNIIFNTPEQRAELSQKAFDYIDWQETVKDDRIVWEYAKSQAQKRDKLNRDTRNTI